MAIESLDFVFENTAPSLGGTVYSGKEGATQFWQDFFCESPQAHVEIEEIFGLGLRCVMRWRYGWVDVTRKTEYARGVDLFRVKDGFICERLSYVKGK